MSQFLLVWGPLVVSLASLLWVPLTGLQSSGETDLSKSTLILNSDCLQNLFPCGKRTHIGPLLLGQQESLMLWLRQSSVTGHIINRPPPSPDPVLPALKGKARSDIGRLELSLLPWDLSSMKHKPEPAGFCLDFKSGAKEKQAKKLELPLINLARTEVTRSITWLLGE